MAREPQRKPPERPARIAGHHQVGDEESSGRRVNRRRRCPPRTARPAYPGSPAPAAGGRDRRPPTTSSAPCGARQAPPSPIAHSAARGAARAPSALRQPCSAPTPRMDTRAVSRRPASRSTGRPATHAPSPLGEVDERELLPVADTANAVTRHRPWRRRLQPREVRIHALRRGQRGIARHEQHAGGRGGDHRQPKCAEHAPNPPNRVSGHRETPCLG
jgi:hypothetical protein